MTDNSGSSLGYKVRIVLNYVNLVNGKILRQSIGDNVLDFQMEEGKFLAHDATITYNL